ncbi:sulfotransferase family protein [Sphingomonas sp. MMS24-JH45]
MADADAAQRATWQRLYLEELSRFSGEGVLVTDKRCADVLHLGLVKTLFPRARMVHTVRSPLDTILSTFFLQFGEGASYSSSLDDITTFYVAYRRVVDHWRSQFGSQIIDVRYEALTRDPTGEIERLAAQLDVPPLARDADMHHRAAIRTPSTWQVRRPVHTRSVGRWRNYEAMLTPVIRALETAGIDPEQ